MSFAEKIKITFKDKPKLIVALGIFVIALLLLGRSLPKTQEPAMDISPDNQNVEVEAPAADQPQASGLGLEPKQDRLVLAYLVQEDAESLASFNRHVDKIDIVSPNWFFIGLGNCEIRNKTNPKTAKSLLDREVAVMPILTNGDNIGWRKKETQALLNDSRSRECMANSVIKAVEKQGYAGLNVDFETLEPGDFSNYAEFLKLLADGLHASGKRLIVNLAVGDLTKDLSEISKPADAVLLMNYDEHYPGSQPGPVASQNWFMSNLNFAYNSLPRQKLIMGLGVYGYDWDLDAKTTKVLKYKDVQAMLLETGVARERDQESKNLKMSYLDPGNRRHEAWFLDGPALWQQWLLIRDYPIQGIGLWRLGQEDPAIWDFID